MKKVGILSMQRIANYGSFLQAYGLKSMIEELGCEVEFVDYHPGETLIPPSGGKGLRRKISKVMEVVKYKIPIRQKIAFILYKKNFSKNNFKYLGITEEMNYSPELDILVIGSDEVFNCVQNNTNVGFSPELFGKGNHAKKVISYAASCGNTTHAKMKEFHIDQQVAEWLDDFDNISVRDENTANVVKALIHKEPLVHIDPVLAYDFMKKCQLIQKKESLEKYLILYGYSGRFTEDECKEIRRFAKKNGYKVYCFGGVQNCCDKFIDCSPYEVLSYFCNAECVITDTFHGTIMSVITRRQFVSLIRQSGYGNKEKMVDLLHKLGLASRILEEMNKLDELIFNPINYDTVDEFLSCERQKSYEYLRKEILGE